MRLKAGHRGEDVKVLQRNLNKLGELVLVDGDFGSSTREAVRNVRVTLGMPGPAEADDELQARLAAAPDLFPPLTSAGVTFIAREEVSSAAAYRRQYQTPCLPPAPSGITIGIGYDCRFVTTKRDLESDWSDVLSAADIDRLVAVIGVPGTPQLCEHVAEVVVPLGGAMRVFATRSLPKYFELTRQIYPELTDPALDAAKRTALVSLIYNRGNSLDGDRRTEMRTIQALLAARRFSEVAAQFESMTRLWQGVAAGLVKRRQSEATLWRSGFRALQLE